MSEAVEEFGFGPHVCASVKAVNVNRSVKLSTGTSVRFDLTHGVSQGLISPYLFLIYAQLLPGFIQLYPLRGSLKSACR